MNSDEVINRFLQGLDSAHLSPEREVILRSLIVKGDMTQQGRPSELQVAAELLGQWPGPVLAATRGHRIMALR